MSLVNKIFFMSNINEPFSNLDADLVSMSHQQLLEEVIKLEPESGNTGIHQDMSYAGITLNFGIYSLKKRYRR